MSSRWQRGNREKGVVSMMLSVAKYTWPFYPFYHHQMSWGQGPQNLLIRSGIALSGMLAYHREIFTATLGLCSLSFVSLLRLLTFHWIFFSSLAFEEQVLFFFSWQRTLSECDPSNFTRLFNWTWNSRLKVSLAFSVMLKSHTLFWFPIVDISPVCFFISCLKTCRLLPLSPKVVFF